MLYVHLSTAGCWLQDAATLPTQSSTVSLPPVCSGVVIEAEVSQSAVVAYHDMVQCSGKAGQSRVSSQSLV